MNKKWVMIYILALTFVTIGTLTRSIAFNIAGILVMIASIFIKKKKINI